MSSARLRMLGSILASALTIAALSLSSAVAVAAPVHDTRAKRAQTSAPVRPFSPDSFWNKPLSASAPLDANSKAYVDALRWETSAYGTWINTSIWSTPVYTVPANQPTVRVHLDKFDPTLQSAFDEVPIPANAAPAAGGDSHLVVWQPSTDTMWEFWRAARLVDGWHASFGGRMRNVSTNPGHFTDPTGWGATATSLPLLGGLMRIDEVRSGRIDHALALAIPLARAKYFTWPAQRTDGTTDNPSAPAEGMRFRINPKVDLSRISMSPMVRMMAVAAQRYGIVVRDVAGAVTFYGEDPAPTGVNPWGGFYGQAYPSELLKQFPWSSLQALRADLHLRTS